MKSRTQTTVQFEDVQPAESGSRGKQMNVETNVSKTDAAELKQIGQHAGVGHSYILRKLVRNFLVASKQE